MFLRPCSGKSFSAKWGFYTAWLGIHVMFQSLIEMISDFATVVAQRAVGYIAGHSNFKKDGIALYLVKFVVSVIVYLAVIIGVPLLVIGVCIVIFNLTFSKH